MVYRLSMAVDSNLCLEIEHGTLTELCDDFDTMGGDSNWLLNAAKASVARSLHGEAVGNLVRGGLSGQVIEDKDFPAGATPVQEQSAATARTAPSEDTGPADPWTSDRDEFPGEASVARTALTSRYDGDPWGSDAQAPRGRQRSPESRTAPPERQPVSTVRDKFEREWTTGLSGAPACDCGDLAARVKAKSQAGNWYTTWKCAKGAGSDYRLKCSFSEFPD